MIKLVLNNKKEINVQETSTIYRITILCKKFSELDDIYNQFTKENLELCSLNNEKYAHIIPVSKNIEVVDEDAIYLNVFNREMTEDEKRDMQLTELQVGVTDLAIQVAELMEKEGE